MTAKWRISDIIDLEYFLEADRSGSRGQKAGKESHAERQTYLAYARNHQGPVERRALFKFWLDAKRKKAASGGESPGALPGTVYKETLSLTRLILCLIAFGIGALISWSLLSYGGSTPVNVFTCLWVLLAPQLLLLTALALSAAHRWLSPARPFKVIYPLISALIRRFSQRIIKYTASKLPADKRTRIQSTMGLIGQTRTLYGGLFLWPVFITAQLAGICYNFGILGAMLVRVTITDLAFGWQSTLQPDPQSVYRIVSAISSPWAWLTDPPVSHPTLKQIAGSKMVLKEGIYQLATADLVAWWPFLCLAVAFYGLLPRLLLTAAGIWQKRRRLSRLTFTHAGCERLWQAMKAPDVSTISRPYGQRSTTNVPEPEAGHPDKGAAASEALEPAFILLPEEISPERKELALLIRQHLGYQSDQILSTTGDPELDARQLTEAMGTDPKQANRIVFVQEAWLPPIKEALGWIRHIKQAAGANAVMVIALIGKPDADTVLTAASDTDRMIWRQAINALGDPYIRVESLGG